MNEYLAQLSVHSFYHMLVYHEDGRIRKMNEDAFLSFRVSAALSNYPLKRKRVASNRPRPSRGATFRRRYELVKSVI